MFPIMQCFTFVGEVDMSLEDGDDDELLNALEEVESMKNT